MDKMKTNQDGGSVTAQDSSAAGKQLEKNQAKEGAAKYKRGAADGHMKDEKKGAAKYKGAHDYKKGAAKKKPDANGNGVPDYAEDGVGAARMGYSQSFGAARMNGYAKGAAKVQDIMTNGASKKMHGAADAGHGGKEGHEHGIFDLGRAKRTISSAASTAMKVGRTALRTAGDVGVQALDFIQPDPKNIGSGGNSDGFNLGGSRAAMADAHRAKDFENTHFNKTRQMVKEGKIYDTGLADKLDDSGYQRGGFNEEHNTGNFGGILPSGKRNPKYKGN
jgi:hypothetical protein